MEIIYNQNLNFMDFIYNLLPSWKSPIGILFIGLFIYVFSMLFANFLTPRLNKMVNFENKLKNRIKKNRNKFKKF